LRGHERPNQHHAAEKRDGPFGLRPRHVRDRMATRLVLADSGVRPRPATSNNRTKKLAVEHVAHARRKLLKQGLREQLDTRVEPTLMDDGVSGVTGCEKDLETGPYFSRLVCQYPPGFSRENHVRK
jgi:hypothetical protein